ncbi:MAG TPA: cysteine--tRNA ligase [Gemmatimonadales bacterium]|nr:cysteine--tRNA ligase [Gemmatimonadales bacterium]
MALRLHNTLTGQVEPFVPLDPPHVSFYACGPTVYNYAHLGNFRTFLFEDLLRRWLDASGYQVLQIMNLTDVDDKTIRGAREAGMQLRDYVEQYIKAFFEDRDYLRIRPATVYPRATEHIPAMIALIDDLLAKGIAYRGEDGSVYFAIDRFPAYGKLSRLDRRELKAGASERVSADEYAKEDARDFVLWKATRPEDEEVGAVWDAPFGRGRPGWHIECSAMSLEVVRQRLGQDVLDIHAGGIDLVFPHHEDEIAQSCAYTGRELFARYWIHGEFLHIRGEKMSKRFGNITTARDLREDGVDAGAVRLLLFGVHYRQRLDLTDEALAGAREGSRRLGEFRDRLVERAGDQAGEDPALAEAAEAARARFAEALDDDLNAPRALAQLFGLATEGNAMMDRGARPGPRTLAAWRAMDGVLDVCPPAARRLRVDVGAVAGEGELDESPPEGPPEAAEAWALSWAARRKVARQGRNFAEADRIRALLAAAGWEVRDARDGSLEVRRSGR